MGINKGDNARKQGILLILPTPFCKLFQIHGSKSKLHPVCNLSQACVSGITHTVLLFGIRKDTLYGFFPCLVHPLVDRCISGIVSHFLVFFPDVPGDCFDEILVVCAKVSGGTVGTYFWIALILPVRPCHNLRPKRSC